MSKERPAGRNAACLCGSGRKYKHCCGKADAAEKLNPEIPSLQEVAAGATRWEIDAIPLSVNIEDMSAHRLVAILIGADGFVIHAEMRDRLSGEPELLAKALAREVLTAARSIGSFPEVLAVRHPELCDPLLSALNGKASRVEVAGRLEIEPAARAMAEEMTGMPFWPPVSIAASWGAWRLPAASIRDLFAAAAEFWRRAPWSAMADTQTVEVVLPSKRRWTVGVMGHGRVEFGLSLYSDSTDIAVLARQREPLSRPDSVEGRVITVTYDPVADVPDTMRVEARTAGWEIASSEAFPLLMTMNTPGGGITVAEVEDLTAVLRAIPAFAEEHAAVFQREREVPYLAEFEWQDSASGIVFSYDGGVLDVDGEDLDYEMDDFDLEDDLDVDFDEADQAEVMQILNDVLLELGPDANPADVMALTMERSKEIVQRLADRLD